MADYVMLNTCSQCGECCLSAFINSKMSKNNNVINGRQYCDFAYAFNDKILCRLIEKIILVTSADVSIGQTLDTEIVTNEIKSMIDMTAEQFEYCANIMSFPDVNNEEKGQWWKQVLDDKVKFGIPSCTFSYKEAD